MPALDLNAVSWIEWSLHLLNPLNAVRQALSIGREKGIATLIKKIWLAPTVISVLINVVFFYRLGIDFEQHRAFAALYLLVTSLKLIVDASFLFLLLRLLGQVTDFDAVMACFTPYVIYGPFFTILSLQSSYRVFSALRMLRAQHTSLLQSVQFLVLHVKEVFPDSDFSARALAEIAVYGTSLLSLGLTVVVAECLTQTCRTERHRTYLAVCLASFFSAVPKLPLATSQWALVGILLS